MTASASIEQNIEAEQLRTKIRSLTKENAILRETQSPAAGPLELQAENIILRREAELLGESLPEFVPYRGALPETLERFNALHAAHQRQILSEHPDYLKKLQEAHALVGEADRHGQREVRRLAGLKEAGVTSIEEFAALPAEQRRSLVMKMTPQQRQALLGLSVAAGPGNQDDWHDDPRRRGYL